MKTLIIQHIGLGDAIICNALTRRIVGARSGHTCGLFINPDYRESIAFMFRDLPNLTLIDAPRKNTWPAIWKQVDAMDGVEAINLTMFRRDDDDSWQGGLFDVNFYQYAKEPLWIKWAEFYYRRDMSIEIQPPERPYWFVHDDPVRGYRIEPECLKRAPAIVRPAVKIPNVFRLRRIIEAAEEVHVINSAFLNLIDFFEPKGKLFWHYYARRFEGMSDPTLQLDWSKLL